MERKICSRCKKILGVDNFSKDRGNRTGLSPWCKKCHYEYEKDYRKKRRIEIRNKDRKYRSGEKSIKTRKIYVKTHQIEIKKRGKDYCQENPEKAYAHRKIHYVFNNNKNTVQRSDFECAICGKQPVDFHHENYDLWFVVIPLCKRHHMQIHKSGVVE